MIAHFVQWTSVNCKWEDDLRLYWKPLHVTWKLSISNRYSFDSIRYKFKFNMVAFLHLKKYSMVFCPEKCKSSLDSSSIKLDSWSIFIMVKVFASQKYSMLFCPQGE